MLCVGNDGPSCGCGHSCGAIWAKNRCQSCDTEFGSRRKSAYSASTNEALMLLKSWTSSVNNAMVGFRGRERGARCEASDDGLET